MDTERRDYRTDVTRKIIDLVERGVAPWQKPWSGNAGAAALRMPYNVTTGRAYRGGNALHLMVTAQVNGWEDPRWVTFKQAKEQGWDIKKGSHGTSVEYWKFEDVEEIKDEVTGEISTVRVKLDRPYVFYGVVFNGEQVSGMPEYVAPVRPDGWNPVAEAERILSGSGVKIIHDQANNAFYHPSTDQVHLPPKVAFSSEVDYYEVAMHEVAHSTGHPSRLGRDLTGSFGSASYAREELRAQMASLFLSMEVGVPFNPERHAAYQSSWLQVLKSDKHELFRAARDAEAIADYVLAMSLNHTLEDQAQLGPLGERSIAQQYDWDLANPEQGVRASEVGRYAFEKMLARAGITGEDAWAVWAQRADVVAHLNSSTGDEVLASMEATLVREAPTDILDALVAVAVDEELSVQAEQASLDSQRNSLLTTMGKAKEWAADQDLLCMHASKLGLGEQSIAQCRAVTATILVQMQERVAAIGARLQALDLVLEAEAEACFVDAEVGRFNTKPTEASVRGSAGWIEGEYHGETVFTNGRLLDLSGSAPHIKGWDAHKAEREPMRESTIKRVVPAFTSQMQKLELVGGYRAEKQVHALLAREDADLVYEVDGNYLRYFTSKFKGAEFFGVPGDETGGSTLIVQFKGQVVGVVMPRKPTDPRTGAEVRGILQRNSCRESKVSEEQAAMPAPAAQKAAPDHVNGFTKGLIPVAAGKLKKALNQQVEVDGVSASVRQHVERICAGGTARLGTTSESKLLPMDEEQRSRSSYEQIRSHEEAVKKAGCTTIYTVNGIDLGKTGHDYAKHLEHEKCVALQGAVLFVLEEGNTTVFAQDMVETLGREAVQSMIERVRDQIEGSPFWQEHCADRFAGVQELLASVDGLNVPVPVSAVLGDAQIIAEAKSAGIKGHYEIGQDGKLRGVPFDPVHAVHGDHVADAAIPAHPDPVVEREAELAVPGM